MSTDIIRNDRDTFCTSLKCPSGVCAQNKFYKELLVQVENVLKEIKEIFNTYEVLVEQCRKRFGSSVAEQQCKRKKKRNAQKVLKRKAKKGQRTSTCTNLQWERTKQGGRREISHRWVVYRGRNWRLIQYNIQLHSLFWLYSNYWVISSYSG